MRVGRKWISESELDSSLCLEWSVTQPAARDHFASWSALHDG